MQPFAFAAGSTPLLVSMPHVGTHVPVDLAGRMTAAARGVPDTDWHVDRLYDFLPQLGAGVIRATHSRLVIDLNRAPDGRPLYPGASNTELCPTTLFDETPVYAAGEAPDAAETAARLVAYWRPYHDRLAAELAALKARFGVALLFDAHSIRSEAPRFFAGRLPDLNIGTGGGGSAAPDLAARVVEAAAEAEGYSSVLNGRFKGGYITRHYGDPGEGIHAVQLELSEITYMNEQPPFEFREDLAARVRPQIRVLLEEFLRAAPHPAPPPR